MKSLPRPETVLVIPPNDPEAVLIKQIAKAMGLAVISLGQPHGARLEKETDLPERIIDGGWKHVVIVETPGPSMEERLQAKGIQVVIVDHHEYTGLDRAHDKSGKRLPSSLDQFLHVFGVSDEELTFLGFDPRLVHGVAFFDRGFVWELQKEGYAKHEILSVIAYSKELMHSIRPDTDEEKREAIAVRIWEERVPWHGFLILLNDTPYQVRSRVSLLCALDAWKPTPLILVEPTRGFIYVQESDAAQTLFSTFGGFTFGQGNNWGIKMDDGADHKVTLDMVKEVLTRM